MANGVGFREGPKGKSYFYTLWVTSPGGKRRQEQKRGFRSERAAAKARALRLAEIEKGELPASTQNVSEYLAFWLERHRENLAPGSYLCYEQAIRTHLAPQLGRYRLDRLGALEIETAYAKIRAGGATHSRTRYFHTILNMALRRAVKWRLLPRNPCDDVELPRPPRELEPEDRHVRALSDAETRRLLAQYEMGGTAWLAAMIALGTGLRRGEVLALRWQDVDLDGDTRVLRVRQSVDGTQAKKNGVTLGPPKSEASVRELTAPARLLEELRQHRARLAERRLLLGPDRWRDMDLIIPNDDGSVMHPSTLTRWHRAARVAAELPEVRFHDLRHTHATGLLRAGVDPTTVSKRLGHSSVTITLNTYSHVLKEMQDRAGDIADLILDRALAG